MEQMLDTFPHNKLQGVLAAAVAAVVALLLARQQEQVIQGLAQCVVSWMVVQGVLRPHHQAQRDLLAAQVTQLLVQIIVLNCYFESSFVQLASK